MSMFDSRAGSQTRTGVAVAAAALSALAVPPAVAQQVITTQDRLSTSYSPTSNTSTTMIDGSTGAGLQALAFRQSVTSETRGATARLTLHTAIFEIGVGFVTPQRMANELAGRSWGLSALTLGTSGFNFSTNSQPFDVTQNLISTSTYSNLAAPTVHQVIMNGQQISQTIFSLSYDIQFPNQEGTFLFGLAPVNQSQQPEFRFGIPSTANAVGGSISETPRDWRLFTTSAGVQTATWVIPGPSNSSLGAFRLDVTTIPNPGTAALLGLAGLAAARRRR